MRNTNSIKTIVGIVFCILGLFFLAGAIKMWPDLRPLGTSIVLFFCGAVVLTTAFFRKQWNAKMYAGTVMLSGGLVSVFAATGFFPDYRPFLLMVVISMAGLAVLLMGFLNKKIDLFILTAGGLFVIPVLLLPAINRQRPGDPAAVLILSTLTGLGLIYALAKNHQSKRLVGYAGLITIINFCLIPVYEKGYLNFIGRFYRLFVPIYEKFDPYAQMIEYALILVTVILTILCIVKRVRVQDFGKITMLYFILMPLMAIFLFEMFGLPAGFLAGDTTRSDLLVTDTNAVMSTLGIIFIAATMYISFHIFPFWVTPILAGIWWVFWKPWLLHHPDPALFVDFSTFWPAALFLFFTGLKRVVLPMILLIMALDSRKKAKTAAGLPHAGPRRKTSKY
ncbi:MAG: hypothetical protein QHH10_12110 [Peptococcaceae bacterium]|jgi:hypothetical protein|nr:hypothetical protein [Peptococcaceae bacterium]MDH7526048.1 hypothetical protein [Peptococcaceae bacterium]